MNKVSVCMPYFERLEEYEATLASFKAAGYFHSFSHVFNLEISVCDDGSKNNPVKECMDDRYIISRLPEKEKWLNPCVATNKAVNQSTGDIILLQGPETMHRVPIIGKMLELLMSANDPDLTTILCPAKETDPRRAKMGWRLHQIHQPKPLWFCQMMTRKLWETVGGFDEGFRQSRCGYEDDDFAYRLKMLDVKWVWLPEEDHVLHPYTGAKTHPKYHKKMIHGGSLFKEKHGLEAHQIWSEYTWRKENGARYTHPENRG